MSLDFLLTRQTFLNNVRDGGVFYRKLELSLMKVQKFDPSTPPSTLLEGC